MICYNCKKPLTESLAYFFVVPDEGKETFCKECRKNISKQIKREINKQINFQEPDPETRGDVMKKSMKGEKRKPPKEPKSISTLISENEPKKESAYIDILPLSLANLMSRTHLTKIQTGDALVFDVKCILLKMGWLENSAKEGKPLVKENEEIYFNYKILKKIKGDKTSRGIELDLLKFDNNKMTSDIYEIKKGTEFDTEKGKEVGQKLLKSSEICKEKGYTESRIYFVSFDAETDKEALDACKGGITGIGEPLTGINFCKKFGILDIDYKWIKNNRSKIVIPKNIEYFCDEVFCFIKNDSVLSKKYGLK